MLKSGSVNYPFDHDVSGVMDEVIGPPGLSQEAFNRTLTQAEGALE